jgi:acyl-CoA synthetase (AMP-forming)/AMP-acid ligase II
VYTSGTTGTPKGAMLTHGNLSAAARVGCELIGAGPQTVTVATLPLFHVFGMSAIMNVTLHAHGLLTLVPRFEPGKVLEVIERDRATTFGGVPTMFAALLHHPERERHDVSSINLCVSGGAPMPVEVLRGFDEAFGATVLEGYGLTETTGMGTFTPREIEEVLYEHPAVREAAVLGVPHSSLGEEVGAAVSLKQGSSEVKPEELRDWLKQRVAAYKYPRLVWIVDELPKGPTGKILKREIELPETAKAR